MIQTVLLRRGDIVTAIKSLDPEGADVRRGTQGVVFEETNAYGDDGGPMVRWANMGACNVYDGDVSVLTNHPKCGHSACRQNWIDHGESKCISKVSS